MSWIRSGLRELIRYSGHDPSGGKPERRGEDLAADLKGFVADPKVIFDVGANKGQSARYYLENFPDCQVHAFEPVAELFQDLSAAMEGERSVTLNNVAVGATPGPHRFLVNSDFYMSSFLEPGPQAWGAVTRETTVEVVTLDDYCARKGIESIDVLKSDTQGYDLEVLKGARGLMEAGRIGLILVEIIFAELYKDGARVEDI